MSGLILFEVVVLGFLSVLVAKRQHAELLERTDQRLEFLASSIALQIEPMMEDGQFASIDRIASGMRSAPGIHAIQITDLRGRTIASSEAEAKGSMTLSPQERSFLRNLGKPAIFWADKRTREAVAPIHVHGDMQALVWIYPDDSRDRKQLQDLLRTTLLSAVFGIVGCTIFAAFIAREIARPLGTLTNATRSLSRDPEDTSAFPIPVTTANEAADLTMAFNLMVASMSEQRAGLSDTLALLDSMLANAPIGFAFFDHRLRMVRVNQFLAKMNDLPVSRHLGKEIEEVFVPSAAHKLKAGIQQVFETGHAVRDVEIVSDESTSGLLDHASPQNASAGTNEIRSWLANIYPVRTDAHTVRWVGVILVETTERRRAEAVLRKSEKLAATGRLAASIAHEINNPLEAVTNLLYLIRQGRLDQESLQYAQLAQDEVARMSEITQQMLRFYRQSTKPVRSNVSGMLDSVMALHSRRAAGLQIDISRSYESAIELFCFAGEMRQLFNNLIANAIDAMTPGGGRLSLRVKRVRRDSVSGLPGVRVTVADTGTGMTPDVRRHIFEPFFTTKEDTGTGLGLWVSSEIIEKHKGSVRIRTRARNEDGRNESGKTSGTVFSLFFPSDLENMLRPESPEVEQTEAL
jgi:signal transduction histidine kinase